MSKLKSLNSFKVTKKNKKKNTKNKIKKSKRSNLKYNKNKIGGVKLGQGSYGCVVTPPAKCIRNPYLRKNNYIIDDLYVSKIIDTKYSEVSFSELNIGKKISSLDPTQNFLIPTINACYFTPQKHIDIVYLKDNGRHISSSPDSTEISDSIIDEEDYSSFTIRTTLPSKIAKENKNKCIWCISRTVFKHSYSPIQKFNAKSCTNIACN